MNSLGSKRAHLFRFEPLAFHFHEHPALLKAIIYSRRNKLCGLCNQVLPPELLFGAVEAERIESLLAQERQRHKRWIVRASIAR